MQAPIPRAGGEIARECKAIGAGLDLGYIPLAMGFGAGFPARGVPHRTAQARQGGTTVLQNRNNLRRADRPMMSMAEPLAETGAGRIGAELRGARMRLGWSVVDVAAYLRLRESYVDAIEGGRVEELPGHAYAIGFVRNYARLLGLNADEMARRFRSETSALRRKTELAFLAPAPERGVPAGAALLIGLLLMCLAYTVWFQLSARPEHAADTAPPVPDRLARLIAPAEGASTSPQVASVLPPAEPGASGLGGLGVSGLVSAPIAPPSAGGRIAIRAKADCWVEVQNRSTGAVLLARQLKAGESWLASPGVPVLLRAANPDALDVLVDGAAIPLPNAGPGFGPGLGPGLGQELGQGTSPAISPGTSHELAAAQTASAAISNSTARAVSQ